MNTYLIKDTRYLTAGILMVIATTLVLLLPSATVTAGESNFSAYVDEDGNISLPSDFRMSMVHLGSWFVPVGGASGFHDVYTEAQSAQYYRQHGTFPDGATVVKELRPAAFGDYSTGKNVSYATAGIKQWFVMIKDTKGRFKGNLVWGDGWGWALIKTDDPQKNLATNYRTDCLGCHLPAKKTDWIYTEAYPTLTAIK